MVFGMSGPQNGGKADGNSAADATALKAAAVTIMLIVAGFLGNYFAVPLFFGADFLFGSIAVLLILYFRGFGWGM
jgi:hypothetical protein